MTLSCECWGHWTVVKSIAERQLRFFDSSKRKKNLNRSRCTICEPTRKRPYTIIPQNLSLYSLTIM